MSTFEVFAVQKTVVPHVPDDRFDGVASFEFAPDAARHAALLSGFEHLDIINIVTAITQIDITTFGTKAC